MKIAVIDMEGNVIDTYEDIDASDALDPFPEGIVDWLRKTIRIGGRREEAIARKQADAIASAEIIEVRP